MTEDVAAKVQIFFNRYTERSYSAGQIIVFPEDDPPGIFYLVRGKVRQYDISYKGDEIVVNVFKPGAFLPMSWALTRAENRFFFDAATDIVVRQAPADEVVAFLRENPEVAFDLLTRVFTGLDGLLQRTAYLMGRSAKSRLLLELLIEARRFGDKYPTGSYLIKISETDLAARTGLSRETINREIKKLKASGLVEVRRQTVLIHDLMTVEAAINEDA